MSSATEVAAANPAQAGSHGLSGPGRTGLLFNVAVTALDVGVALIAFDLARRAGASEATAYLLGTIGPLLGAGVVWWRSREWSGASIAVLAFTLLSAAATLIGSHAAGALLYKDAVVTGVVGLLFAVSMLFRRPLAFYFGQRYATDGTRAEMQAWDELWCYQEFRRANYTITVVWACAYVIEAGVQALVIHSAGFDSAYLWGQILPWVAAGLATLATVVIARRR